MSAAASMFSPTLESVQQAFNQWRSTRGKRTRTPIGLRRRAVALRETYRASHICSALKINDTALKRWAADLPSDTPPLHGPTAGLVELPTQSALLDAAATDSFAPVTDCVSIHLGDAIQLRVHGNFTLEQVLYAARQHQQGEH